MATLMVDFIISLDGYGAAEGWPSYWGLEGPEYLAWLNEDSLAEEGLVYLMGANTYRIMSPWAGKNNDAASLAMDAARKVVFSSTLTEPLSWANTELVTGDAIAAVREMKQSESRQLSTLGSVSLSRALITAGLVDRLRVVIFPVLTGRTGHEPVFDGYPDLSLELVESRSFDTGTQLLEYIPKVLDGPLPPGPTRA
jgi:dihydrofolate reductase